MHNYLKNYHIPTFFLHFADSASQYIYIYIYISVIHQLDAQNLFHNKFISCLYMFRAQVHIIRRSKLHYTASGIITPIGGRLVHKSSLNLCTRRPPIGVMIPEAV